MTMVEWKTKNPPKTEGRYLVTTKTILFGRRVRHAERGKNYAGEWCWYVLPSSTPCKTVIAWAEEPKPYEGEKNERL